MGGKWLNCTSRCCGWWMREEIAGSEVCMLGADRVRCGAYAMSSAGVPPTTQYVACWGQYLGVTRSSQLLFPRGLEEGAGVSSARSYVRLEAWCCWLGVQQRLRVASNSASRSLEVSTNSSMHRTPQLSAVIWAGARRGARGEECLNRIVLWENKADGWDKTGLRLADSAMMHERYYDTTIS